MKMAMSVIYSFLLKKVVMVNSILVLTQRTLLGRLSLEY